MKPINRNRAGFWRITLVKHVKALVTLLFLHTKWQKGKIYFELCLTGGKTGGNIVKSPDPGSFEKFLHAVMERAAYYDNDFTILENCLESISAEELIRNHASWHRKCYQAGHGSSSENL